MKRESNNIYKIFLGVIFAIGVILRLKGYLINPSFWHDEAALALNIINRNFTELFKALDGGQTAPLGFILGAKFLLCLFKPTNLYFQDLILRFIPLISGILSLPAFYYLTKLFLKDRKSIFIANTFMALNPCAIYYSYQFKQYSTELLVGIILFILSYKIIFQNKHKWYFIPIVMLAPYFSLSSFFIILSTAIFILLRKHFKLFFVYSFFFVISIGILYCINLKSIFEYNYLYMHQCWDNTYAMLSFIHPSRLFRTIGQFFVNDDKIIASITGLVVTLLILINSIKNFKMTYLLLVVPLLITVAASFLGQYPFIVRLILFLLPAIVIMISIRSDKFSQILQVVLFTVTVYYTFNQYLPDHSSILYSYSRDIVKYIQNNPSDVILIENDGEEYLYYLNSLNIEIPVSVIPISCKNNDDCDAYIEQLPASKSYYLCLTGNFNNDYTKYNSRINLQIEPKNIKAIRIDK